MVSIRSLILLILSATFCFGEKLSPDEQKRYETAFTQSQKNLKTFSADLKQSLQLSGMKKPVVSQGKIFFQNPQGWLRINYSRPVGEFILLRDLQLFIKKRNKSLRIRNIKDEEKNSFAMMQRFFQQGAEFWRKDFQVTMSKNSAQLTVYMIPKKEDRTQPQEISTHVDLKTFLPQEIKLQFEGDNELSYQFSKTQRNQPLPSNIFNPPKL